MGYFISVMVFFAAYALMYILDKEEYKWKSADNKHVIIIFACSALLSAYGVSQSYMLEAQYAGCVLSGYLTFCALTDYTDKYIYAVPLAVICCIFFFIIRCSMYYMVFLSILITVIYLICCRTGNMGKGDIYAISATAIMLNSIEKLAICLIISSVIFVLQNLRHIDVKRLSLKEKQAYVPAVLFGMTAAMFL